MRDNISGITKPSIRKLARRGGVRRISASIYPDVRGVIKWWLEDVLRDVAMIVDHADRKIVTTVDVVFALRRRGRTVYVSLLNGWLEQH